jgi:hypothetical protein
MQKFALEGCVKVPQLVPSLLIGVALLKGADAEVGVVHTDALLGEVADLPLGVPTIDSLGSQHLDASGDGPIRTLHPTWMTFSVRSLGADVMLRSRLHLINLTPLIGFVEHFRPPMTLLMELGQRDRLRV